MKNVSNIQLGAGLCRAIFVLFLSFFSLQKADAQVIVIVNEDFCHALQQRLISSSSSNALFTIALNSQSISIQSNALFENTVTFELIDMNGVSKLKTSWTKQYQNATMTWDGTQNQRYTLIVSSADCIESFNIIMVE